MHAPGDRIDGRFELVERLGSGGMGTVWRALDTVLGREVALKQVRPPDPAAAEEPAVRRGRVLREARALARLSHPHVVTVHQILEPVGEPHPWIVMELLPGRTLQDRLAQGPLPPAEAAGIGRQVLSALKAAHAAGIRHRDVKPANVLLRTDGSAVLTDFGIAALQGSSSLTATGDLIGSPEYMAPERIRGTGDDPASDLWSLGLVLYRAVEGVSPLRRATTLATLAAVLDDPVPPPVRSGPLAPVLTALLVRDPAARPDHDRLDALLAEVEAGRAPDPGPAPHWTAEQPTRTAQAPPPLPPPPVSGQPPVSGRPPAPTPAPTPAPAPGPTVASRRTAASGRRAVVLAVVAVAVTLVTATALVLALREDGKGSNGKDPDVPAGSTTPAGSPSAGPSESRTQSSTPSTGTATPSTPPPSTPQPARDEGRWVAMLFSEPTSTGTAARDKRLAKIRQTVPDADYLLSDDYASLRPGYWVIHTGSFPDGRAALTYCAGIGRTDKNSCIGRYISTDSADFGLQCYPPAASPSGTCRRR
ncbi:serine/threonine-protein kinase [Streptomyces sp. KLOTTS4A1]|uniref:serine/threonine-protein kinase n=1 Tax=Streptomyces sp. KLOTTS4A1 TaxID=3390996 RepID=UPI0039F5DAB5